MLLCSRVFFPPLSCEAGLQLSVKTGSTRLGRNESNREGGGGGGPELLSLAHLLRGREGGEIDR